MTRKIQCLDELLWLSRIFGLDLAWSCVRVEDGSCIPVMAGPTYPHSQLDPTAHEGPLSPHLQSGQRWLEQCCNLSLGEKEILAVEGSLLSGSHSCLLLTWRCKENVYSISHCAQIANCHLSLLYFWSCFFSLKIKANLLIKKKKKWHNLIHSHLSLFPFCVFPLFIFVSMYNEHSARSFFF